MKTILSMAMTVNGKIAKPDGDSDFTSKEDGKLFLSMCRKAGNAIIGKNTYMYIQSKGYQQKNILTVVLTRNAALLVKKSPNTIFTDKPPKDILTLLEEKGYKEALVAGDGILNTAFFKEGLIDEMYIDIEPLILGRGIPLFADGDFAPRLKLLGVKTLTNHQTIQLHYKFFK